jgi:hypothetical protein
MNELPDRMFIKTAGELGMLRHLQQECTQPD